MLCVPLHRHIACTRDDTPAPAAHRPRGSRLSCDGFTSCTLLSRSRFRLGSGLRPPRARRGSDQLRPLPVARQFDPRRRVCGKSSKTQLTDVPENGHKLRETSRRGTARSARNVPARAACVDSETAHAIRARKPLAKRRVEVLPAARQPEARSDADQRGARGDEEMAATQAPQRPSSEGGSPCDDKESRDKAETAVSVGVPAMQTRPSDKGTARRARPTRTNQTRQAR